VLTRFLDRRLGPVGLLIVAVCGAAVIFGLTRVVPKKEDPKPAASTPTPAVASTCRPASSTFGKPPDTFAYEKVPESMRAQTVKALKLDEAEGKVKMIKAARGGLTLGQLVAVPGKDPADYASSLVAAAQQGGAKITRGQGFAIVPLDTGQKIAVGVRGCDTILITAQDPNAVQFLAANVFSASGG
jgi:hypothetical protein